MNGVEYVYLAGVEERIEEYESAFCCGPSEPHDSDAAFYWRLHHDAQNIARAAVIDLQDLLALIREKNAADARSSSFREPLTTEDK